MEIYDSVYILHCILLQMFHSVLQEYHTAQTGPRKQIQHLFVWVFSLEDKVSLLLLYKLSTHLKIFCWHKRVCVCMCMFVYVCVFVCVCWRGTDRNLGVCSCHNEMSIFMTCCLLFRMCELFLLQTSASDICTFKHIRMSRNYKASKIKLTVDSSCSLLSTSSALRFFSFKKTKPLFIWRRFTDSNTFFFRRAL